MAEGVQMRTILVSYFIAIAVVPSIGILALTKLLTDEAISAPQYLFGLGMCLGVYLLGIVGMPSIREGRGDQEEETCRE